MDLLNKHEHTPVVVAELLRYTVAQARGAGQGLRQHRASAAWGRAGAWRGPGGAALLNTHASSLRSLLQWDDGRLAAAVIGELAAVDPAEYERQQNASGEKAGVRSVAAFVRELANRLPRCAAAAGGQHVLPWSAALVAAAARQRQLGSSVTCCLLRPALCRLMANQIALLLPHLGGKAHTLRSGIVHAIGTLLHKAFDASSVVDAADAQGAQARLRSKQQLLDVLCERIRWAGAQPGRGPPARASSAGDSGPRACQQHPVRAAPQGPQLLHARGGAPDLGVPGGEPRHPAGPLEGGHLDRHGCVLPPPRGCCRPGQPARRLGGSSQLPALSQRP